MARSGALAPRIGDHGELPREALPRPLAWSRHLDIPTDDTLTLLLEQVDVLHHTEAVPGRPSCVVERSPGLQFAGGRTAGGSLSRPGER